MADIHEHCIHPISDPEAGGTWREICCVCGMSRVATPFKQAPEGHGPHLPDREWLVVTKYGPWA